MATTINAANVSIGFDAKRLREGGQFTRNEIANIKKTMTDAVPASEKLAGSIHNLERAFEAGAIAPDKYSRALTHLNTKLNETNNLSRGVVASARSVSGELTAVAGRYLAIGAAIGGVKKVINLSLEAEQSATSLKVLTGSLQTSQRLIEDFRRMDRESPLSFSAFQDSAKTMMQFGVQARQLTPILDSMSKLSLGNEERLKSMALAFGQVSAAGRLTGQEVLQFVNAGFNPLQQMAKDTGLSVATLRKEMEAGAISVRMVEKAFMNATKEGTNYYNMNEELANTALGKLRKMQTSFEALGKSIGDELTPVIKDLADGLSMVAQNGDAFVSTAKAFTTGAKLFGAIGTDVYNSIAANGKPLQESAIEKLWTSVNDEEVARMRKELEKQYLPKTLEIEPIIKKFTEPIFDTLENTITTACDECAVRWRLSKS